MQGGKNVDKILDALAICRIRANEAETRCCLFEELGNMGVPPGLRLGKRKGGLLDAETMMKWDASSEARFLSFCSTITGQMILLLP
jgi:hypothetical protein